MSLKAKDKYGKLTYIENANRGEMYYCQVCNQPMMQKRGEIRIHHFSHYSPHGKHAEIVPCSDHWNYDMTDWHMSWQKRFPIDNIEKVLEHNNKKHIADLLIGDIVVEFQHSSISLDEFTERNEFYTTLGYKVVWVFDLIEERENGRFADNDYEGYYKWAFAKKLFREMVFSEVKATIYFQTSDDERDEVGVLERVKDVYDEGRRVKIDSNCIFSIKEFIDSVTQNSKDLFEKPKAPNSIDCCSPIRELWNDSYSTIIVKNKHTNEVFYIFGQDGNIIRDYRTGKARCKYAYLDCETNFYKEKGDYYNIQDEEKRIWILIHAFKDKCYEQRVKRREDERKRAEEERATRLKEKKEFSSVESDEYNTINEITRSNNKHTLVVYNAYTKKHYFLRFVNSYRSFNIYAFDIDIGTLESTISLNHEMNKLYSYRIWKVVDF